MPTETEIKYPTPRQPRQIRLDTTCRCNASCVSCHRHLTKRKGEMPIELIREVLDDVMKWPDPLEEIVPVNYGEFFMREDWFDILIMIAQKLPYTEITLATNGSLIDESAVVKLCKIPNFRVINFSINAYFDETYKAFNGLKPEVIPQIRKTIAQFRILRPDIRLKVSMVFDPEYQTDLERDYFESFWKGWAETWVIAAASAGRGTKLIKPVRMPCRSIFDGLVIGYDGKISSCCFDPDFSLDLGKYVGNALENWHSKELTELRRLHNEGKREGLCKECTFA